MYVIVYQFSIQPIEAQSSIIEIFSNSINLDETPKILMSRQDLHILSLSKTFGPTHDILVQSR